MRNIVGYSILIAIVGVALIWGSVYLRQHYKERKQAQLDKRARDELARQREENEYLDQQLEGNDD